MMMTVSSVSRSPRAVMPQDPRRKSCDDYDAINPDFPPPSLKSSQNDSGRELERRKKKDKKWSIGGLFRRKKKVSDTDSSSPIDDEEEKKGFLERRRAARKRRNRGSKDVTGSFEHVILNHANRPNLETVSPDRGKSREVSNERLVRRSHESLAKREQEVNQEVSQTRGSSVSLEGVGRKGGRILVKARVEASREKLKVDSSSDEEGGSSRHSSSSVQRLKSDENMGSKDGSLSRRSRAARTERYKKRLSRDDESLRDFQVNTPSRISRSDEKLSNKKAEKVPPGNRWTAKVVYYESSDYDTKYTAKTKSATPSPIQSPKARPKNSLHYTASAPAGSTYVTFPPSHAREGVAGSYQELRSQHYPTPVSQNVHKPNQRYMDITPPRLPKSDMNKVPLANSIQKHYPSWGQDVLNRKSASYDCNVNNLHYVNNQISQPHPTDENVLVVQFPISRPAQKMESKPNKVGVNPSHHLAKQLNPPPPPPPRDPHRRLVPSNSHQQHETSPRPMSYAFEDRNQHQIKYPVFPDFGSSISAFQRVPQANMTDFQPIQAINKHHRSSSDHQIPSRISSVKNSPPSSRRPSSVQPEAVNRTLNPVNPESFASSPPSEVPQTGVPHHYQYYTDQQPRSRKPIHIAYQNQKPPNDSYLSDSQVIVKPPIQQVPRARPIAVQNASEFWKQKEQESAMKVHLSEGSPKLIQKHFLNVSTTNDRSRSNSPHNESNVVVTSRLKLPPLIIPVRGAESSGSLSGQSSPRDLPSPRTPSSRKLVHNEIGIPVFDGSDNNMSKRDYRPLSMLEEKQEISEQEVSPAREKPNNPPKPPTRRDSKVNAITNFEHFDIFSDENEQTEARRKSSNLEEALNELEAIYKSLRLGEDGYLENIAKEQSVYENNRLDPTNWNAWVQSRGFESDSSFNYSRSSLESVDSIDSPLKKPFKARRSGVPDRVTDDMAYRRLNKKDRPQPQEQEVISQAGSFLLVSPTLSPPPFVEPTPPAPVKNEPDVTLDDVVYRNIKHMNNSLKVLDPQPPFGIPLGPIAPATNSDYLHITPKESYRPTFKPRKTPDVITDDLAFRNLRKDGNKEPLFTPEDTTLIDSPTLRKKRAVRSLSANLLSIIQKESIALNKSHKLMHNNNNSVQSDLEKSQSFTDVSDAVSVNGSNSKKEFIEQRNLSHLTTRKSFSGEDSDVTPRVSRHFSVGSSSPLIATSTETLTGSKTSLWTQEPKSDGQKVSQNSSPRRSVTPERRHTVDNIQFQTRNSVSPANHLANKSESFKIQFHINPLKSKLPDLKRSPTPDSHTYTHQSDIQRKPSPPVYDQTESDLLAILAREATEASEQLSKELNELNFDSKIKSSIEKSPDSIAFKGIENQETINTCKETVTNQLQSKPLPIGKIIPHKPVKLNTFYITEDNKLENKQTVVTNKPIEIEGSKSMTDLLKELTKSLDFDFGGSKKDEEKRTSSTSESNIEAPEERAEKTENLNETTEQEIFSETIEPRTTDRKECDETYFSSLEEVPDQSLSSPERSLLSSLRETAPVEQSEPRGVRTVSPVNSFPLEIPEDNCVKEVSKSPVPDVQSANNKQTAVPSEELQPDKPHSSNDRVPGGCSLDCSSLADEGKTCLKSCVTRWTSCVNSNV